MSTTLGCRDIGVRKSEFGKKTQFLCSSYIRCCKNYFFYRVYYFGKMNPHFYNISLLHQIVKFEISKVYTIRLQRYREYKFKFVAKTQFHFWKPPITN